MVPSKGPPTQNSLISMTCSCYIFENSYSQMCEGDGLPSLICHRCLYHIEKANEFKEQCEQSDALLRRFVAHQVNIQLWHIISAVLHIPNNLLLTHLAHPRRQKRQQIISPNRNLPSASIVFHSSIPLSSNRVWH